MAERVEEKDLARLAAALDAQGAAERDARHAAERVGLLRELIAAKYGLGEGDRVTRDGAIVRKAPGEAAGTEA